MWVNPLTDPILVLLDSDDPSPPGGVSRCIYFAIVSDEPSPGWILGLGRDQLPFLMLGLQGIVYAPLNGRRFDSASDIDGLFQAIENGRPDVNEPFDVETQSIWLPKQLLETAKRLADSNSDTERGDAFRIVYPLFREAWRAMNDGAPTDLSWLLDQTSDTLSVEFSPLETRAFAEWSEIQLRGASGLSISP